MVNPRQPREARSSTAQTSDRQLVSPGSRPITLTRRRVSPKVRSMKLECRIRGPVLAREPQVDGQRVAVGEQAVHRRRVGVAPAGGERVDAGLHELHRVEAGLDGFGQVEESQ